VTGGSRGIGKAVVERLAAARFHVCFTYVKSPDAARELVERLAEGHEQASAFCVDSRDAAASSELVQRLITDFGRIDVLVNNAAITADKPLPMLSEQDWTSVLSTSLNGLFGASKAASKQMMRQRSGRIVNLTSVSGLVGIPGQTNYCTAKAGIIGFTRALAKELAPWGIPVNALAPGAIETDMLAAQTEDQLASLRTRIPMRRFGLPEEIAEVVRFLATDAPAYLTGQVLVVDGGLTG
jgi:3-oxoacyl-[acyl-carrier protein] reductase